MAQDHQAVVDRQRSQQYPAYDYCNRAVRRWRRMFTPAGPNGYQTLGQLQLKGRYTIFTSAVGTPEYHVALLDTRTGAVGTADYEVVYGSAPSLELSPEGVAAVMVPERGGGLDSGVTALWALTLRGQQGLDAVCTGISCYSTPRGTLGNLQLYDCVAGCAPNVVTVAWVDSGVDRYAQVQGSSSVSSTRVARPTPRCVAPRGWRVVASDSSAVVIRGRGQYPTYRYCLRANHRFHLLFRIFRPGSPPPLNGPPSLRHLSLLRLRGPYAMFAELDPTGYTIFLWDLRKPWLNGSTGASPPAQASPSTVLLSPTGVAAWIAPGDDIGKQGAFETVDVLSGTSTMVVLDNGGQYQSDALANLALYRCAAGCAPNATVVAWTHMTPAGIEQKYYTLG